MIAVGIDIGGTKTEFAAANAGASLGAYRVATDDWRIRVPQTDAHVLIRVTRDFVGGVDPAMIVVGAHGCDSAEDCEAFQAHLAEHTAASVLVLNDSELLLPAAGVEAGISVIAGTGSIAVARRPDATMMSAGGWGWFLGDEGSASGLVRDAAKALRSAMDKGETSDPLGSALLASLGITDPLTIGRAIMNEGSASKVGRHVHAVFAAAQQGSGLAASVIRDGGEALALLVDRLIGRGAVGGHVVAGGGVIARQPGLMEAFRQAVERVHPDWTVTLLTAPPVEGALSLATRLLRGETIPNLPSPTAGKLSARVGGTARQAAIEHAIPATDRRNG
ncbi:BadF-type ATPase [Faunimonas pinastri]|uniref:BadF-type ATPase n=1 Tax=Faunimonas pinastri TaxID=1855383 RepID=A0A1H9CLG0_9HYPH|nr:BadF/BadG/BcrA/BcrD ATPase family protein [Faunimonas pinastri]SEQ01887.1 BadF-type ATPase [Faunimonas pinastri]